MASKPTSPPLSPFQNWKFHAWILTLTSVLTVTWYLTLAAWPDYTALFSRYTAGHPIEYAETFLFFWAASALCSYLVRQQWEFRHLRRLQLSLNAHAPNQQDRDTRFSPACGELESRSLVSQRWQQFCERLNRDPDSLSHELSQWDEENAQLRDSEYTLIRYFIWAIPILGFLGTVIGITQAIGSVQPEEITNSISGVTAGLAVAFDTTAVALVYSLALMLLLFLCQRRDDLLLRSLANLLRTALDIYHQKNHSTKLVREQDLVALFEQCYHKHLQFWQQAFAEQWQAHIRQACDHISTELDRWRLMFHETEQRWHQEWQARHRELLDSYKPLIARLQEVTRSLVSLSNQLAQAQQQAAECLAGEERMLRLQASLHQCLQSLAQADTLNKTLHSLTAAVHLLTSRVEISRAA